MKPSDMTTAAAQRARLEAIAAQRSISQPPAVLRAALTPRQCDELIAHHGRQDVARRAAWPHRNSVDSAPPLTAEWRTTWRRLSQQAAAAFDLEVERTRLFIRRCDTGSRFPEHLDTVPGSPTPNFSSITFAYSVALAKPGDYIGGELRFRDHGAVPLGQGDLCAFQGSENLHEVTTVTRGVRWVAVAFCGLRSGAMPPGDVTLIDQDPAA